MCPITNHLKQYCYLLDSISILELNKTDNQIQSVISKESEQYLGVKVYKNSKSVLYYITNVTELEGICLELSHRRNIESRTHIVLEFSKLIAKQYKKVNFLEAFNRFQLKGCNEFKKYGFVTATQDFNLYTNKIVYRQSHQKRRVLLFAVINIPAFYSWFFDTQKHISFLEQGVVVIYLLYNKTTHLIKICESTIQRFNKCQILNTNNNCDMIASWKAPLNEEKKLTYMLKDREQNDYWYRLTFDDLQILKNRINTYNFPKHSYQKYRQAI